MTRWTVEEKKLTIEGGIHKWKRLDATSADIPAGASYSSPGVEALYFDMGSLSLTWSGLDGSGQIEIESSLDGENYCKVDGMTIDLAAADHALAGFPDFEYRFFRFSYTPGTATVGTINARYLLKSRQ